SEIHILESAPIAGQDVVDKLGQVDFTTSPISDIEQLFKSYATQPYEVHPGLVKYLFQTPTTIYTLPNRPTGLTLVQGAGNIALNWAANSEADITGYKVYRGTQPGNATLLATTTINSFTDLTAVNGTLYYYSISTIDGEDESYRSDEVANTAAAPTAITIPGKVEAENYSAMSGVQIENCDDVGGGQDAGYIDPDDYLEYTINSTTAGSFIIDYRLASNTGSLGFELLVDGVKIDALAVPATGGWQVWQTISSPQFTVSAGTHTLRFRAIGGQWNVNYIDIKAVN
ncbi:MAG: carbohydrate-binding protein, partial [Moraxellaceae bacterium]